MTKIKEGYKETEIGVIPVEWEVVKVGTILNVQTGKMNAQDQVDGGKYPFFTRSVDVQSIDTYAYDTEALFIAGEGNFKVKYYKGKFNLHQRTYMLTSIDDNNMKFLLNSIQPKVTKLISTSVGSTVQSLRKPIIEALKIPLPPLKEQEKIADILCSADDKIDAIASQIEKAETLKKGLLQKLLSEGIGHSEFKDSELGKIPLGWEVVEIRDIGKVSMCKRIMKNETTDCGKIPFYKIGTFGKEANAYISEEVYEEYKNKYSFPKQGDILISASGTIGRLVVYNGEPAYFQDSNIVWIANQEDKVLNSFLFYTYKTVKWHTDGNTIARLYNENLRRIRIPLPPLEEQKQIAEILSTSDEKLEVLRDKKQKYETLKKGLLQKLLSGEIRV